MALNEQVIQLRFASGVETKADPKTVPIVKLLAAENVVLTRAGSLSKRNGYDLLGRKLDDGSEYLLGRTLAARDDELLLFADGRLLSHRPSTGTWSDVGGVSAVTSTERPVIKTGTHQTEADAWAADGIVVAAWEDSRGGVWAAVMEEGTDRVLRPAQQIDELGSSPKVIRVGTVFHIYWLRTSSSDIRIAVINPLALLAPITSGILADGVSVLAPAFDVDTTTRGGDPAVIVWPTDGGDVRLSYVDASGVLGSPVTGHPTGSTIAGAAPMGGPVSVSWSSTGSSGLGGIAITVPLFGSDITVIIVDDDNLSAVIFNDSVPDLAEPAAIRCSIIFAPTAAGEVFRVWVSVESTTTLPQNAKSSFSRIAGLIGGGLEVFQATLPGGGLFVRGHGLGSRLFEQDGAIYSMILHSVPFFPYAALVRFDDSLVITTAGRAQPGVSNGLLSRRSLPAVPPSTGDPSVRLWPGLYREQVIADPNGRQFTETGIRLVEFDFADDDALQSARLGGDLVIAGSCPLRYDGDTVAELGFHTAPDGEILAAPGTAIGGGLSSGETYGIQGCWMEVDAAGEIHPGPMSVPIQVTLGVADNQITTTWPTYRLTSKRRSFLAVFRTVGNDDTTDPRFFRASSLSPSATGPNGFIVNDLTVDTVTFVDVLSDDDLILREEAYTNFGVLSNDPAPLGSLVAGGKNRLFFSDASDPNAIRYSQQRRDGFGVEVSADLRLPIDPEGGAITALDVLDDAVIVFKRGSTYFFAGPGPLPDPDREPQISFSDPQLVTSDVGCISPRSLAVTPIGLIFKAARGYHLIDRARQVRYVGAPVESFNGLNVVGAVALPNRTAILVLHSDGPALLYDYYFNEWCVFTWHEARAGVVAGEQFYFLRNDIENRVAQENRFSFLDGNRQIRMYIETAWIRFAAYAQGWQKIWYAHILGTWKSAHKLLVRVATDYRPGWDTPFVVEPDTVHDPNNYGEGPYGDGPYGGDGDQVYQSRIHVSEQCQAIRFSFEDAPDGTLPLAASLELTELLLNGGTVRATVKPAPSRSY